MITDVVLVGGTLDGLRFAIRDRLPTEIRFGACAREGGVHYLLEPERLLSPVRRYIRIHQD